MRRYTNLHVYRYLLPIEILTAGQSVTGVINEKFLAEI